MDSITQIILGAAVGEAVLGRKIGNKAMFWGAVAGTIPDLDIFLGPFLSKTDALIIHRGFSHSISFAVGAAGIFAYLINRMYNSSYFKWIAVSGWSLFFALIAFTLLYFNPTGLHLGYSLVVMALVAGIAIWWLRLTYFKKDPQKIDIGFKDWYLLFFWAFLTHPILDCFTMYGTQFFWPFSNYRVGLNMISVVDPVYTIPFLICLLVAAFYKQGSVSRFRWNWAGIAVSSFYLLFTGVNKTIINHEFEKQLAEQNITYTRYITGPTILNNILWNATVESDSIYYQGMYSWFDTSPIHFKIIEKNHHLITDSDDDRTLRILKWFSKGYYNVIVKQDGKMQINDLRFGTFNDKDNGENVYIFRFIIEKNVEGEYELLDATGGPPPGDEKSLLKDLIDRIKGR